MDWKPTRSPELEAELELDDVEQMLEAQNARRRASGRPEITEDDVRAQVAEDERWRASMRRRTPRREAAPMARVLIVGCGCRGRALAARAGRRGARRARHHARPGAAVEAIEAAGAEGVVADPDRLGTLLPLLAGVTVVCWLMGKRRGPPRPSCTARACRPCSSVVDTPVRGVVYEAAGSGRRRAADGRAPTRSRAAERAPGACRWRVIDADPAEHAAWLAEMRAAVDGVLLGPC